MVPVRLPRSPVWPGVFVGLLAGQSAGTPENPPASSDWGRVPMDGKALREALIEENSPPSVGHRGPPSASRPVPGSGPQSACRLESLSPSVQGGGVGAVGILSAPGDEAYKAVDLGPAKWYG